MTHAPTFALRRSDLPAHLRPEGKARKFTLEASGSVTIPADAGLCSGGTRESFELVELTSGVASPALVERSSPWSQARRDFTFALPKGFALRVTSTFLGRACPTRFVANPSDLAKLLPAHAEVGAA